VGKEVDAMQRSTRTRPARTLAILASAALLVTGLTASPAAADHDRHGNGGRHTDRHDETQADHAYDNGQRSHGRHNTKHRAHARHHHPNRAEAVRHANDARRHYRKHVRHAGRTSYTCHGCQQHFGSRVHLERHVVHRHHIPRWQLGQVIVFTTLGWIFHG
jgi:hypothetical protein